MTAPDIIALVAIALVIGGAVFYIIKAKKSGKKCIGCPDSPTCSGSCRNCTCCSHGEKAESEDEA